jgi:DNA-binding IclR family transcriptional regulator
MAKTPSAPALDRGLSIMELLASSTNGLTLPELTRRLKLPKSSVHSLLLTLERRGYLSRNTTAKRYLFGLKVFSLANMALNGIQLRERAAPFLRALMERTHLTVHLGIREQDEIVLIEKVEAPGLLRIATWVGKRMDLHCSGLGKALIAYLPEKDLLRLFADRILPRYNENTIVSSRRLREDVKRTRCLGYSADDEEGEIGFRCLGAPIFDQTGTAVAAISVAGSTVQITSENLTSIGVMVKEAAASISRCLGFDPELQNVQLPRLGAAASSAVLKIRETSA